MFKEPFAKSILDLFVRKLLECIIAPFLINTILVTSLMLSFLGCKSKLLELENLGTCVCKSIDGSYTSSNIISVDDIVIPDVSGIVDFLVTAQILVVDSGMNLSLVYLVNFVRVRSSHLAYKYFLK